MSKNKTKQEGKGLVFQNFKVFRGCDPTAHSKELNKDLNFLKDSHKIIGAARD